MAAQQQAEKALADRLNELRSRLRHKQDVAAKLKALGSSVDPPPGSFLEPPPGHHGPYVQHDASSAGQLLNFEPPAAVELVSAAPGTLRDDVEAVPLQAFLSDRGKITSLRTLAEKMGQRRDKQQPGEAPAATTKSAPTVQQRRAPQPPVPMEPSVVNDAEAEVEVIEVEDEAKKSMLTVAGASANDRHVTLQSEKKRTKVRVKKRRKLVPAEEMEVTPEPELRVEVAELDIEEAGRPQDVAGISNQAAASSPEPEVGAETTSASLRAKLASGAAAGVAKRKQGKDRVKRPNLSWLSVLSPSRPQVPERQARQLRPKNRVEKNHDTAATTCDTEAATSTCRQLEKRDATGAGLSAEPQSGDSHAGDGGEDEASSVVPRARSESEATVEQEPSMSRKPKPKLGIAANSLRPKMKAAKVDDQEAPERKEKRKIKSNRNEENRQEVRREDSTEKRLRGKSYDCGAVASTESLRLVSLQDVRLPLKMSRTPDEGASSQLSEEHCVSRKKRSQDHHRRTPVRRRRSPSRPSPQRQSRCPRSCSLRKDPRQRRSCQRSRRRSPSRRCGRDRQRRPSQPRTPARMRLSPTRRQPSRKRGKPWQRTGPRQRSNPRQRSKPRQHSELRQRREPRRHSKSRQFEPHPRSEPQQRGERQHVLRQRSAPRQRSGSQQRNKPRLRSEPRQRSELRRRGESRRRGEPQDCTESRQRSERRQRSKPRQHSIPQQQAVLIEEAKAPPPKKARRSLSSQSRNIRSSSGESCAVDLRSQRERNAAEAARFRAPSRGPETSDALQNEALPEASGIPVSFGPNAEQAAPPATPPREETATAMSIEAPQEDAPPKFVAGTRIRLKGLEKNAALNGICGSVITLDTANSQEVVPGTVRINLDTGQEVAVKPLNLDVLQVPTSTVAESIEDVVSSVAASTTKETGQAQGKFSPVDPLQIDRKQHQQQQHEEHQQQEEQHPELLQQQVRQDEDSHDEKFAWESPDDKSEEEIGLESPDDKSEEEPQTKKLQDQLSPEENQQKESCQAEKGCEEGLLEEEPKENKPREVQPVRDELQEDEIEKDQPREDQAEKDKPHEEETEQGT